MRKQTKLWKTKDNRKIRICDMSDSHLNNTIAMLERTTKALESAALEASYRCKAFFDGEAAEYQIENEITHLRERGLDPEEVFPIYKNLIAERERRRKDEKTIKSF